MFSGMPEKPKLSWNFKEHQIPAEKAGKLPFAMVRSVPKSVGTQLMWRSFGLNFFFFSIKNISLGEGILAIKNTVIANHYVYDFVNLSLVFS